MSGIAGCALGGAEAQVTTMLERIGHRGPSGSLIGGAPDATLGVVWTDGQTVAERTLRSELTAVDCGGPGRMAMAACSSNGLRLTRDRIGIAPLYYGSDEDGVLYFASEVKALLPFIRRAKCLPPGCALSDGTLRRYVPPIESGAVTRSSGAVAGELRARLSEAVRQSITGEEMCSWLSGGIDSSVIAALARPHVRRLRTFAAGLPGATDLEYARQVAEHIDSEHYEIVVGLHEMLRILPDVIYHLESFDALLVRSSILNYIVGRAASGFGDATLSGEGADELFAGYDYLKELDDAQLDAELLEITGQLHNTALQRVDRCSSAHGMIAHVPFLAPDVVDLAFRIPVKFKLRNGVEKWIVREAAEDLLPESVLNRTKSKFWEGSGVGNMLAEHAEASVSDADFAVERMLPNGWELRTKEELMNYRVFREHFGELEALDWMGRTKGAPQA
jgi:asparagine synthase (glutamine-hydrolysing)